MSAQEDGGGRITVSREALRAELLALELRLADRLAAKADLQEVKELNVRMTKVENDVRDLGTQVPVGRIVKLEERMEGVEDSVLNPEAVATMVGEALRNQSARGWTNRERILQAVVAMTVLATFVMTLVLNRPG